MENYSDYTSGAASTLLEAIRKEFNNEDEMIAHFVELHNIVPICAKKMKLLKKENTKLTEKCSLLETEVKKLEVENEHLVECVESREKEKMCFVSEADAKMKHLVESAEKEIKKLKNEINSLVQEKEAAEKKLLEAEAVEKKRLEAEAAEKKRQNYRSSWSFLKNEISEQGEKKTAEESEEKKEDDTEKTAVDGEAKTAEAGEKKEEDGEKTTKSEVADNISTLFPGDSKTTRSMSFANPLERGSHTHSRHSTKVDTPPSGSMDFVNPLVYPSGHPTNYPTNNGGGDGGGDGSNMRSAPIENGDGIDARRMDIFKDELRNFSDELRAELADIIES